MEGSNHLLVHMLYSMATFEASDKMMAIFSDTVIEYENTLSVFCVLSVCAESSSSSDSNLHSDANCNRQLLVCDELVFVHQ